ncbi:ribosome-inactivating family protein [Streptomyces sp. yr375]|uniref:ribosome-inactivating family protein n=1 Tax=Streptomyces sp. yr375 TaxID=1761906 RepID=UPI00210E2A98|nr:ribosome-inactivating family protein [Streptomyces sp. yr375]
MEDHQRAGRRPDQLRRPAQRHQTGRVRAPGQTGGGRPVDVTDANGTQQFIAVDLYSEGGGEFIRVFMRRSDAYVMGWRPGTDNGGGNITWRNFFTLEPGVDLPGAIRTGTGANVTTRFEGLSNYTDLQRQGASRDNMQLTPSSLSNAVLTLHDGFTPNVPTRLAAPAILRSSWASPRPPGSATRRPRPRRPGAPDSRSRSPRPTSRTTTVGAC